MNTTTESNPDRAAYIAQQQRRRELRDRCFMAAMWTESLGSADTKEFIDRLFDSVIAFIMKSDPRSRLELELYFAGMRTKSADELTDLIDDLSPKDEVIDHIVDDLVKDDENLNTQMEETL